MFELYWGCLIFGVLFTIVTILFGDLLDSNFEGFFHIFSLDHIEWLQPTVIIGGITIFGGMGLMLTNYTELVDSLVILCSLLAAVILSIFNYFLYSKPMKNCENSAGFFIKNLIGRTGEVMVPIPAIGYGEVLIQIGAGNTNQIAASNDKVELPAGTQVVVINVSEKVLYVSNCMERNRGGIV